MTAELARAFPRQCANTITNGTRRYACNRLATHQDPDGWCGHCRRAYGGLAAEYTCTACWRVVRRGVDGALCVEHADRPADPRYARRV